FGLLDIPGPWAFFVAPDAQTWIDGAPALLEAVRKHRRQERELTVGAHRCFLAVFVAACVAVLRHVHWRHRPRLHATKKSLEVYGLSCIVGAGSRRFVGAALGQRSIYELGHAAGQWVFAAGLDIVDFSCAIPSGAEQMPLASQITIPIGAALKVHARGQPKRIGFSAASHRDSLRPMLEKLQVRAERCWTLVASAHLALHVRAQHLDPTLRANLIMETA